MPIFEYKGKKYNVKDEHIDNFSKDFPDATSIMEHDGKKYRVKSSDYKSFIEESLPQVEQQAAPVSTAPVSEEAPQKPLPAAQDEQPWKPTKQEKMAMMQDLANMNRRTKQMTDSFNERMDNMREYGMGLGMETKEGRKVYDPESGKFEQTYLTPAGNRYSSKALADAESFRLRQAADMSVSGQLRKANQRLADLKAKRKASGERVHEKWEEDRKKNTAPLGFLVAQDTYVPRQMNDKENRALDVAIRQTEELIKDLEEQRDREKGKDVGFWRGFGRTMGDFRTWDFGISDMRDAMTMVHAGQLKGEKATEGEREAYDAMMEAIHEKQQADEQYGGNASFWNRAGVMTGYMPSFMLDFAISGGGFDGINTFSKAGAKTAAKVVGKDFAEELAKEGMKSYIRRNGVKGLGKLAADWTIKALGTTADDLLVRAPLMTNTIQAGKTTADIIDRKLGDVVIDENGNYDFSNDKTWGSAIWQGEANAIIENYSEMFGAHLDPLMSLGNMSKLANTFGAKRLGAVLAKADAGALSGIMGQTHNLFNKMGVSDYFGEVTEEYYGQLWRTMLNLDDAYQQNADGTRTNLFATGQFHGDIWGGMALSMGLMGTGKYTLNAAQYASMKHDVNKADATAREVFGEELWEPLRVAIDLTTNDNIGAVAESIVNDKDMTDAEREAALNYMERSLYLRGFNLGSMANSRGGEQSEEELQANESFLDGYNATSPQEMNDAKNMLDYQRQRLAGLTSEDFIASVDSNPAAALTASVENGNWTDEEKALLCDYINAKQVYDGMIQRVRDDIDGRIDQSNAMIASRSNRSTGMIQGATMKQDDRKVYVVYGNIAPYADGTGVDIHASDGSIIVRDAETGTLEQVSPDAVLSVEEAQDPSEQKRLAADAIRLQLAQEAAGKIDGIVSFNPGDTYTLEGEDGEQIQIQVTANGEGIVDNGDGTVNVTDGANIFQVAKDVIQQAADAANLARVEEFEKQRAAEEMTRKQAAEEAAKPQYAMNDLITLRDGNGNSVRGSITADADADGRYEVYTEDAVNGKRVNLFTRDELDNMIVEHNGEIIKQLQPDGTYQTVWRNEADVDENGNAFVKSDDGTTIFGEITEDTGLSSAPIKLSEGTVNKDGNGYGLRHIEARHGEQIRKAGFASVEDFVKYVAANYDKNNIKVGRRRVNGSGTFIIQKEDVHSNLLYIELSRDGSYWTVNSGGVFRKGYTKKKENVEPVSELPASDTASSDKSFVQTDLEDGSKPADTHSDNQRFSFRKVTNSASEKQENGTRNAETALERIPKDEQGNPVYEQAETPDLAWDAIVEQTGGNEEMAQTVADGMVADKEAALKKIEKTKPKGGRTVEEKIAAEKERKAAVDAAKHELDIWQKIAQTTKRRKIAAESERRRIATEQAALRRAEEEKLRAEREEAERKEREALNGVPDMVDDTPQDARARGYRRVSGHKYDRQAPVPGLQGKKVSVKFGDGIIPTGNIAVIESRRLQPSHIAGQRNPLHFIDEAQPKERNDEASVLSAEKIAGNIRPEEITSSVTAFTGAPTVNARGEAIQGNNRSDALRRMWESHPDQADKYKQYLKDHADEFGLYADDIEAMERPVLVNMLDVEDADAITLGQYVAQDTESGGTERIKPKNAVQKMGADMRTFANLLLSSSDEETSFAGLVDNNGGEVLAWMNRKGYITPTQYKSAFDSKGNLTAEAKNDLKGIMYQSIFQNGNTRLEDMFNAMPAKAQRAILATAYRDYDSPNAERMVEEIQNSIRAYNALSQDEAFVSAKNWKEARMAVEAWKRQYAMDDVTGESYLPADKFSNFAMHLATMYKGESQSLIQGTFNQLYDLIQGTQEETLFEKPDNTPRTLIQAIKETLNIDYNGQQRSNVLAGNSAASQEGQQRSTGGSETGERVENGERTADSAGSIEAESTAGGKVVETPSLLDVVRTLYSKGKEVASKLFQRSFFDVAQTPKFMQGLGLRGDKFTIKYGVIARHLGKDSSHTLTERDWEQLPQALQNPFAISKLTDKNDSYRIYTTLQTESGEFVVVGADVKNAGREIEVNAISTVFGRRNNANLPKNEEVIYWSKEITPEQSSLLERPNFAQYPTEQELSEGKDTTIPPTTNELGEKNAVPSVGEQVQAAEAEVNINPTDKQKEAGNYKKGHIQVGSFNVTIENPKGSVRSGVDAHGNKWQNTMHNTYGYIRGTEGVDGDHIDVFLSNDIDGWNGRKAFVVDQTDTDGSFDEHKVMLGFNDKDEAMKAYLSNYDATWEKTHPGLRISETDMGDFNKWVRSSHHKTKPFADYSTVRKVTADAPASVADGGDEAYKLPGRKGNVQLRVGDEMADEMTPSKRVVYNVVRGMLEDAGVPVEMLTDGQMEKLAGRNKKAALETDSVLHGEHQRTVISSADDAKVLKNLESLAKKYEESEKTEDKTFIGQVANALGSKDKGKSSQYVTFETKNGKIVTIRLSNHNATVSNYDNLKEKDGISIVISPKKNKGMTNDGDAHIVEFYYDAIKLRKAENKPLAEIVRSIQQTLYSGEYKDTTGLAQREEANIAEHIQFLKDGKGVVYGAVASGKIYLNGEHLNPETPLHEYTHLWDEMVRRENPELWKRGVELMKQTPLWDKVVSDPNYADIRDDEDAVASEVHSRLSGKDGAKLLEEMVDKAKKEGAFATAEAVTLNERIKTWLKDMFGALKKTLGKWSKRDLEGLTIEEFSRMPLRDLAEGMNPNANGGDGTRFGFSKPVEQSGNLVALHNIDEPKLRQALELGGFPMPSIAITRSDVGHTSFGDISLIFGKDSIDPTDRRNKVYGEDAWTPTFPQIGYKLNSGKTSDIYRRANDVQSGLPLFNPSDFHPTNYERHIEGFDSESLVNHFKDDYGAKQFYLSERGNAVEKYAQHEAEKYNAFETGLFRKLLDEIGLERLKNNSAEKLETELKQIIGQYLKLDFDSMKPFHVKAKISNTRRKAIDYAENGNTEVRNDIEATKQEIDKRTESGDFEKWLREMFSGIVEKRGIRNNKDWYTPSGTSRKWEQLYDEITLDNVVRQMQSQAAKGGSGLFNGSIFGAAQAEYKTVDDIRRAAQERINAATGEEIEQQRSAITDRLSKIAIPGVDTSKFSDIADMSDNIQDAVAKSHTAKGIYKYLKDVYPGMTMEIAKEIEGIVGDIQKMSARYFEAKPYRAVGFDEVRAAIVPSDTDAGIIRELEDRGIEVRTYQKGDTGQRRQLVAETARGNNLLFHKRLRDDAATSGNIEVDMEDVNRKFNEELETLTPENADRIILNLGRPSAVLRAGGVQDKPMKLYGNKVMKKMRKHGFKQDELRNLPEAMADPIAVFKNYGKEGNRSILTELSTEQGNFLVTLTLGEGHDVDFNVITSVFGKGESNIVDWIKKGFATYINKEKALNYLHHSALKAVTSDNQELSSATKVVENFENPALSDEKENKKADTDKKDEMTFDGKDDNLMQDSDTMYRIRESDAPKKTGTGYKVFVLKNGKLYPPMVANPNGEATPIGVWLDADAAPIAGQSKTGRNQVKAGGKGTQGGSGKLAYRPGWHLGEIPYALQFNRVNPETGEKELFPANFVWAEVKYANDKDYQEEAMSYGMNANGKFQHSLAGLPRIPENGSYRYRTNPNPETDPWIITGAMKVNRLLTPSEVDAMVEDAGREPQQRQEGAVTDEQINAINAEIERTNNVSPRQLRRQMAERVKELADALHLGNVDVVTSVSGLKDGKKRAKGFYTKSTGKITIIVPNNTSIADVEQTLLHEAVAHYGLRQLFGEHFDTFLDNVLNNADESIRRRIVDMATKNGWDFRKATEEYLAGLAERTNFEEAQKTGWWQRIKRFFSDMLDKLGFPNLKGVTLSDNELRYILWRSYENLKDGNRNSLFNEAADIAMQYELGVGEYADSPKAVNERFNEELKRYEKGEMGKNEYIQVGNPMGIMRSFMPNVPIILRQKVVTKANNKHKLTASEIRDLPKSLANPIFVFKSRKNTISVLTELKSNKGQNVFVAMELGTSKQMGHEFLEVNDITTIHGRETENIVNPILENGTLRYVNKEKGIKWLSSAKSNSQAIVTETLSTAAKIVENFENPKIGDGNDVLFRDGDPVMYERQLTRDRYEKRMKSGMYQSREALQDSMLSLKEAMLMIDKRHKHIEDVEGFENAYLGENRLSSVNQAEADAFAHLLFKPMLEEVARLAKNEAERVELTDYMMAKHGLERNRVMAERDAQKDFEEHQKKHPQSKKTLQDFIGEYRKRDHAGLTALTGMDNVADAEAEARAMVDEYESAHDTAPLWEKVNAVSKAILSKQYECGMMSKETYENVRDMYAYYIPLRGFDEKTSGEAYAYLTHRQSAFNAPIKKAEGRRSKADDPFANLQSMAESAIMQGNRNRLVKQKFLNFVLNHPSDLVSVSDLWLQYDAVADEWIPVFPDNIDDNDTPDVVEQKMKDFEDRMRQLAESDPDNYKHGKDTANIPYRVVESRDLRQHQVVVKRNGRDYVVTVNGNPRLAQALNGQTNPDNDISGAIGKIMKASEWVNRHLSAVYTTKNPDFVVSNFVRDMLYTNSMVWIKESPNYALRFHRNVAKANIARMKILLAKHRKGTLDMDKPIEAMFHQFMMNGGETGYANIRDIEQHKNDIKRELKKANGKLKVSRAWDLLGERFDELNRAVENSARFAAFMTSREMGRTIDRAIYDAKEISVNFNKKGSGAKFLGANGQTRLGDTSAFLSGVGRSSYVFWNAAIQGTANFGRQMKRHPAKALTGAAAMFVLGAVIAYLGGSDDDGDDKNAYYNLPEHVRRSNILFRAGNHWISLPLPVEYRTLYGMGELMTSVISGKEHLTGGEIASAIAGQVSQMLPIDVMEGSGGLNAFVPSAAKPLWEAYVAEKSWTGMPLYKNTPYNKDMPEWTKAYKSANKHIVNLAATLNEMTGGDQYTKGAIDINPTKVEYLLNGYFGGVFGTIDKLAKTGETILGDREYDPRNILLANRLVKAGDERTEYRAINNEYFRLKEEHDRVKSRLKHYENDTDKGIFDYAEKIDFLYNSPEYERYEIFEDYRRDIDGLYDELKDVADDDERKQVEDELNALKKEMIEEMEKTRKRK